MSIVYTGLWNMLIQNGMKKNDLIKRIRISSATIAKMGKGEAVSLDVIERICIFFDCDIADVISFNREG